MTMMVAAAAAARPSSRKAKAETQFHNSYNILLLLGQPFSLRIKWLQTGMYVIKTHLGYLS